MSPASLRTVLNAPLLRWDGERAPAFRTWGARVALGGVFAAVPLGWLVTRVKPEDADAWYGAGCVYALAAFLALGLGALVAGLPEMLRWGAMARRFAAAEWRHLRAKRRLTGRILWWLVGLAGWAAMAVMAAQLLRAMHGGYFYGPPYYFRLTHSSELLILMSAGGLIFSAFLPVVVGVSAAVNLAASRRSGAAEHLLMGPFAADLLGWAAVGAQARRAVRVLLVALPYYLAPGLLVADGLVRSEALGPVELDAAVLIAIPLLGLGLLLEVFMIRRAAALGVWLGALISRPAVAAVLAAMGGMGFWVLRLVLMGLAVGLAEEFEHELGDELAVIVATAYFLAVELALFAVLVPLLMWLARSALAAPLGLRLGQWLQRLGGRIALWGERVEGGDRRADGRRRLLLLWDPSWSRGLLGWKATIAAAALAAFGLTCVFPLAADILLPESPEAVDLIFWALTALWTLVLVAGRLAALRVLRALRPPEDPVESGT